MEIVDVNLSPLIAFKILDFSGNFDFKDVNPPEMSYLENCGAMIFVLDVQVLAILQGGALSRGYRVSEADHSVPSEE